MITWQNIKKHVKNGKANLHFSRAEKIQAAYDKVPKETLISNIYKKWTRNSMYYITKNKFPYELHDVDHYVLWYLPDADVRPRIVSRLLKAHFPEKEVRWFYSNNVITQSIPEINHIHVFSMKTA